MKERVIRVGSRESKLAVDQTMLILKQIKKFHPEIEFELITMKTTGDIILDRSLDKVGGKGLFVKELDAALMDGRIDLSIHSLKDMPMEIREDLPVVAFSDRGDPRDVLVYPGRTADKAGSSESCRRQGMETQTDWKRAGTCIGTSSARRKLQLGRLLPGAEFKLIRGNVLTRLNKLDSGEYSSIVLAASGLMRLGFEGRISRFLSTDEVIPAAGQGILAVQGRKGEDYSYLDCVKNQKSHSAALAERSFVRALDGGCSSPIAAYAECLNGELVLKGLYCEEEKDKLVTGKIAGRYEEAEALGYQLAVQLKSKLA